MRNRKAYGRNVTSQGASAAVGFEQGRQPLPRRFGVERAALDGGIHRGLQDQIERNGQDRYGGQLRRFVNLYLNDEDIRYLDNLNSAVKDGDELSIIPAVAGG